MSRNGPFQQGWDGGPILLLLLIALVAIFFAALLQFTGIIDLSVFW